MKTGVNMARVTGQVVKTFGAPVAATARQGVKTISGDVSILRANASRLGGYLSGGTYSDVEGNYDTQVAKIDEATKARIALRAQEEKAVHNATNVSSPNASCGKSRKAVNIEKE